MFDRNRRDFITLLGAAAAWPLAVRAQQSAMPVVGFLHVASQRTYGHVIAGLRRGLAESDFVEGRNVTVEYRWGDGQLDRMPSLLADLLHHQVSVIVASLQGAQAAKSAGVTIPVVFTTSDDPVKEGFVETLNRPGGNMTGAYLFTAELEGKRLGLLHDVVPKATIIAVLINANHPMADAQLRDVQSAAARLGVQLVVVHANSDHDFEAAFATLIEQKAEALLVCASPLFNNTRDQLVALAARHNIPAAFELREFATAGGLLAYGNSIADAYRQLGGCGHSPRIARCYCGYGAFTTAVQANLSQVCIGPRGEQFGTFPRARDEELGEWTKRSLLHRDDRDGKSRCWKLQRQDAHAPAVRAELRDRHGEQSHESTAGNQGDGELSR